MGCCWSRAAGGSLARLSAAPHETHLFSVKYSSMLVAPPDEAEAVIAAIMEKSLANNSRREISGMLSFCRENGAVVQLLEGPKAAVVDLLHTIAADERHRGCRLLAARRLRRRVFANFGMTLCRAPLPAPHAAPSPPAEHLIRLQYASTLAAADAAEARALLSQILSQSTRNNPPRRIHGLLCFHPASLQVVQLLEGPAPAVRALFTAILADARHVDCRLTSEELLRSEAELLCGATWGMLQCDTQAADLRELSSVLRRAHAEAAAAGDAHVEAAVRWVLSPPLPQDLSTPSAAHIM
ncbi:hypothetical protein AB1Y20_011918 [Prymnesium parvum]|uniref:BLUF domain-containing protein n=1 Tax=Prymnesium parvum TaxID=97485 RepID=A0AB34INA6_PRYPA